jgi:hypothetical protein
LNEEIFNDCLKRWNRSDGQPFWQELADKHGHSKRQIRYLFTKERKKRGILVKNQPMSSRMINNKHVDGTYSSDRLIEIFEGDVNDDCALMKAHNYDPDKWVIIESTGGMWHALRMEDKGRVIQFQSKIRVKPLTVQEISIDAIKEYYKNKKFENVVKFPSLLSSNRRVLEMCPSDAHIGSRFFNENHSDLEQIFPRMMADVFARIERDALGFSKIIFAPLGDMFHFSNRKQQTERHQQVVDGNGMNPLEMFDVASQMFIATIDKLLTYAPVEFVYIPGNHDGLSMYHLACRMASHYRDVDTFSTDLGHANRKWKLIGENLIGLEHGEMSKKNRVHWLAVEACEEWGKSKYRETHSGHLHHEEVLEVGGVKTRRLPGIAPTDYWHHESGYTGAIRATMSFVWEEERLGWQEMWQSTGK